MEPSSPQRLRSAAAGLELVRELRLPAPGCLSPHEGTHDLKKPIKDPFFFFYLRAAIGQDGQRPIIDVSHGRARRAKASFNLFRLKCLVTRSSLIAACTLEGGRK